MNKHYRYTCDSEGYWEEPMPWKAGRTRECALCDDWPPIDELTTFKRKDWSTGEWLYLNHRGNQIELCQRCKRLVRNQTDEWSEC